MNGLTDLVRWYRTVTLSNEFRAGRRLDREVNDNLSAADHKQDPPGAAIDAGFPLQSAVVKRCFFVVLNRCYSYFARGNCFIITLFNRIEDPVDGIFKTTKFNRRRIRVTHCYPNRLGIGVRA